MIIRDREGRNLAQVWKSQRRAIRAEFSAGNISVWFTGYVESYSETEIVLARDSDQVSISLFCANFRVIEPDGSSSGIQWQGFSRVVVITTDANTACTLCELNA
ncbi:hypothetical protein [Bremerella cremea]|uniref:hypothetical protein n=1 Tax=Bremerella cremea TaxID=1031537 RepID=UPI0031ED872B